MEKCGEKMAKCKVCGFQGDELDARHIEHAHAVALVHIQAFAEQQERHKRAIAVLSGQKKDAMILGLSREITHLRSELERAQRALEQSTLDLRASIGLEDRP